MLQNLKLKNSKLDITQKLNMWQNSKTRDGTKLNNTRCDKIAKSKCEEKKNIYMTKLKCDKPQKLKKLHKSKTQIW